ncbi:MAG: hypothetical protein EP335_17770 [Alphaproteobacteria bacterium]|nr:MAG: hypothetical protein EP335_17770 [Alphaproteobacteria bacterium]
MTAIFQFTPAITGLERFEAFKAALPLPVTRARRGFGGFITLDLGMPMDPDAVTGEPQWQWHLWIYTCDWDLKRGGERLLWRRESDTAHANLVLERLQGESLTAIDFAEADDCFIFRFTGGYNLHVDPNFYGYDAEDDMFMLFKHGERDVLSYSPDRRFYKAA